MGQDCDMLCLDHDHVPTLSASIILLLAKCLQVGGQSLKIHTSFGETTSGGFVAAVQSRILSNTKVAYLRSVDGHKSY